MAVLHNSLHNYLLLHDLRVFRINQNEFFDPVPIILLFILLFPLSSDISFYCCVIKIGRSQRIGYVCNEIGAFKLQLLSLYKLPVRYLYFPCLFHAHCLLK